MSKNPRPSSTIDQLRLLSELDAPAFESYSALEKFLLNNHVYNRFRNATKLLTPLFDRLVTVGDECQPAVFRAALDPGDDPTRPTFKSRYTERQDAQCYTHITELILPQQRWVSVNDYDSFMLLGRRYDRTPGDSIGDLAVYNAIYGMQHIDIMPDVIRRTASAMLELVDVATASVPETA